MSDFDSTGISGEDIERLGDSAIRAVSVVKDERARSHSRPSDDAEGDERSTRGVDRMLSLREIGDIIGVHYTRVSRKAAQAGIEPAVGRTYGYTLQDLHVLRELCGASKSLKHCVTVAIANFKGGVSKSALTAHLAWHLGLSGYRVLVVDLDPQGTLSAFFGKNPDVDVSEEVTLVPYLRGDQKDLRYAIQDCDIGNLKIIPANLGLASADFILPKHASLQKKPFYASLLREGLNTVKHEFDVVLLDSPPSLSYLMTIATRAADSLLIPLRPGMPDMASSGQFLKMFGGFIRDLDALEGLDEEQVTRYAQVKMVISQWRAIAAEQDVEKIIRGIYGRMVMNQMFPYLPAIQGAAERFRTLYDVSADHVDRKSQMLARAKVEDLFADIEYLIVQTSQWLASRGGES